MLQNIVIIVVASVLAIFIMSEISLFLHYLVVAHQQVLGFLSKFIAGSYAANVVREVIALLTIPLVVALIPSFIYWIFTRQAFIYFTAVLWFVWLLLVAALALHAA
jgi:hypothetical protein